MFIRVCLFLTFPLLLAADVVSFDKPIQIPEAVLQPGKYSIQLEDRMSDRAIVRITNPDGTEHYLLSVPNNKLNAKMKGVIYFPEVAAVRGWACDNCKQPLEFVYPKDEAVKLTGEAHKPVMAYDASYDKLPANLSAADRKVVTLWLLTPKPVGLTAAKYSEPKAMAENKEPLPKVMPKTSTNAFFEIIAGFVSFVAGILVFLWRKVSALPLAWKMTGLTMIGGMVTGFALPLAARYQTVKFYVPPTSQHVVQISTLDDRDAEIERLKARNRRLEALFQARANGFPESN